MKQFRIFLRLVVIMSMMGGKAFAHDIESVNGDGVTIFYEWINNNTELAVCHRGDYDYKYSGKVVIPKSVEYSGSTYNVTSIKEWAFTGCSGLESIIIPNSVTNIGSFAFYCCGLNSVIIPNSVTSIGIDAFYGCSSLTSVTIPNSVRSIGVCAFSQCTSLTSVTIPNSVTSIDIEVFSGCSGLTSVIIPNSVTSIGSDAFYGCTSLTSVTIPNSVTSISHAFYGCSGLTSIKVEKGSTIYDSRDDCNAIIETASNTLIVGCKNTIIPNSVTSIGNYAFSDCWGLKSVTIPNSVTSIGDFAFHDCSTLTSITIPCSVTSIERGAFSGCSGLTSMKVEEGNPIYDSRDNCNAIIMTTFNQLISGCQSTVIPYSVTQIGDWAFDCCSSLTSVTIPNSVTYIGIWAFSGCSGLTSLTIPNSVTSIEYSAFYGCTNLTSVTIPNSVKFISENAFQECTSLTSVSINKETPLKIDWRTFTNRKNATLYVPIGSKVSYETANYWKEFKEIVEMDPDDNLGNANDDNVVDSSDINAIVDYLMKGKTEGFNFNNADANGDQKVNVADIVKIINRIKK